MDRHNKGVFTSRGLYFFLNIVQIDNKKRKLIAHTDEHRNNFVT